MKKIILFLSSIAFGLNAYAQTPVSITGTSYAQNFNTLDTTNTPSSNLPAGWGIFEVGTSASADQMYKGGTGSSNAGDVYSFGNSASPERALGSLRSTTNNTRFGVGFTNNTSSPITSLNISFTGEQWRSGDTASIADSLYLEYSTTAIGLGDTMASWTTNWSTMFNSVTFGLANAAIDGNNASNQAAVNGTITVTVPVGGTIYLRWSDVNLAGSDDGLAIDDLSITFGNGVVNQPLIVSTTPADNATGVAIGTSSLSVTFDKNITIGTGNITVKNLTDATDQVIAVSTTSVAGMTATIPGVVLSAAKSYAVQFDSTCYKNGTYNGYGIYDNTTWNFETVNPKPLITSKSPADNSTGILTTTNAVVTFDKNITAGSGNVTIFNITDNVVAQTIPIASVAISGMTATMSGLTLVMGKSYAIQYDSTCFTASGNNSLGIYDTTTWNFSTIAPPPPPVSALTETFTGCTTTQLGSFVQFSELGTSKWGCTTFGHNDANAVRMNGGVTPTDNTDWLISPPINASAMTQPMINFWSRLRFSGVTTKEVYISSNFTGDPTTATWTLLPVANLASLDTNWKAFNNTNVTSFKATPFNIAFKYVATTANAADEWSIDDVNLNDGPVSIRNVGVEETQFTVLGQANENTIDVLLYNDKAEQFNYAIVDVTGKTIFTGNFNTVSGKNKVSLQSTSMSAGVYFLQIWNATSKGVAKFSK